MSIDLKKEIENNRMVLIIIPNEKYTEAILEIAKQLSNGYKKTCYVSLNKLYKALTKSLENNSIDTKKFCFIDGVTKTAEPNVKSDGNVKYVSSPSALTQLSVMMIADCKEHKPECILFDSLSTLLIYQKGSVVTQFIHSLIGKIRTFDSVGIFTALEGDTDSDLIKEMGMFVDKVIHFKG